MDILIYNLNIGRQIQRLFASFEKNEWNVLWLYCLCKPLIELHQEFLLFSIEQRDEAYANSQTLLLAYRLNRRFDTVLKRIYIVNHTLNNPVSLSIHFSVYVPTTVDAEAVRRFVEKYVIVDKSFVILN
jgi:hypothetical protein